MLKRGGSRCYPVVNNTIESLQRHCVSFPDAAPPGRRAASPAEERLTPRLKSNADAQGSNCEMLKSRASKLQADICATGARGDEVPG